METQIADPSNEYKVSPEALEIAKTYLQCFDSKETALMLNIEEEKVAYYLRKPEVKRFVDTIFLEQGYMNRDKLQKVMDNLFEIKLEEMEDSEMGTSKDILDLITVQHKMRMEYLKELKDLFPNPPTSTTQVNVGDSAIQEMGTNYHSLLDKLVKVQK